MLRLAVGVDGVGVKSKGVGVVESLSSGETRGSRVAVSKVISARAVNAVGVSLLVKDSGGLVLCVARRGKSRKTGEEDRAVGDVAGGGNGVSQDVGRATAVLIIAVGGSGGAGATAVTGNCGQASRDGVLGGCGGRLEVCAELGTSAGCGSSGGGEPVAVGQSSANGGELGASAAGLDGAALGQVNSLGDLSSLSTINGDGELLRVVGEGARELSGVLLSVRDQALGEDLEVTTIVERVKSSSLNSDFLGLSSLEGNEVLSSQTSGQETKLNALERNLVGYT